MQNYSVKIIFYQLNQFVVQQKKQSNFYKNNQFLNSKFNQRFSFQRTYDQFSSNKCLYCYQKNHVFKHDCSNFQNDMFNNRIYMYKKKIFRIFSRWNASCMHVNWTQSAWLCNNFEKIQWNNFFIIVDFRSVSCDFSNRVFDRFAIRF